MQIIKSLLKLIVFVCPLTATAQSTYLNQGSKESQFIERLEIKQQTNTDLNFSTLKPFNRKDIVREVEFLDSARLGYADSTGVDIHKEWTDLDLSPVDEYNLRSLLKNNREWVTTSHDDFVSRRKPLLNAFYKTQANMLEVNVKDFFLAVNPILNLRVAAQSDSSGKSIFVNTRGINVRGLIANKIGFSSTITENQERGPNFLYNQVQASRGLPGYGFYKQFKSGTAFDYFDARGYITFGATKYINVQFGYDKNFIGSGYRSMFLSDWGNSNLFLKLNTKIWKLNYQNLFMELMPQFDKNHGDLLLDRKYAAMHHLSMNVTKWLNVGLFEGIIFGRRNHFDFQYLNPIIFYRHVEGTIGSPDNAVAGLDFKANVAHRLQFYGQFLLDEFRLKDIVKNSKSWVNKYAYQIGGKYVDAFGVKNLDLQGEINRVRPFMYSHDDSTANYTHYNQPLADPLGANFQEYIGIVRYQPYNKWSIDATLIYYNKGLDSAGTNFGGDIFKDYRTRNQPDNNFVVGGGAKAKCLNAMLNVAYEFRQNLFFEASFQHRTFKVDGVNKSGEGNTWASLGIRLNFARRVYDF